MADSKQSSNSMKPEKVKVDQQTPKKSHDMVDESKTALEVTYDNLPDTPWPRYLGVATIKGHIVFGPLNKMKDGDEVHLRREKQVLANV